MSSASVARPHGPCGKLEASRDALAKPRQGGRANILAAELRETRRDLARARADADGFARWQADADLKSDEVERLRRDLDASRIESRDLELLQRCWNVVVARRQAAAKLAELPALSEEDLQALNVEPRVRELRVALSGHVERLDQFDETQGRRAGLAQSIDERVEKLGPWAIDVAGDASVNLVSLREQLEECATVVAKATADRDAAGGMVTRARDELRATPPAEEDVTAVPGMAELDHRLAALRELRGLVAEWDALARELEHDAERERLRRDRAEAQNRPASLNGGALTGAISAVVLFAIAALLLARGQRAVGVMAGVAGLAFAIAVAVLALSRRRAGASGAQVAGAEALPEFRPDRLDRLQAIRSRIADRAASCGVPEPAALVSIERAMDEAALQVVERRRLDDLARVESEQLGRLRSAEAGLEGAERALAHARSDVGAVADQGGLPASADPARLLRLVAQLTELRERIDAVRRIDADAKQDEDGLRRFESGLYQLAGSLGLQLELPPGAGRLSADAIERILRTAEARIAAAREARRKPGRARIGTERRR